jgi:hypothetical protein
MKRGKGEMVKWSKGKQMSVFPFAISPFPPFPVCPLCLCVSVVKYFLEGNV